jgi:hypothetical protein
MYSATATKNGKNGKTLKNVRTQFQNGSASNRNDKKGEKMINKEEISLDEKSNRVFVSIIADDKEIYDTLYNKNAGERIDLIKRSMKIGIMALKNAAITVDTNYVQKEVERLIAEIDNNLKANLGKEGMKGELEKTFGKNGYLENSLRERFKEHDDTISIIFKEDNISSPLYKIKRFIEENSKQTDNNVYKMLDPGNKDSLLFRLKEDLTRKIEEIKKSGDSETINKLVASIGEANRAGNDGIKREIEGFKYDYNNRFIDLKKSVHEEIGGISNAVTNANIELAKLVKEKQVVDITTLKGMKFEDVLFEFLSTKALVKYGDTIDVVNLSGGDKAGDILINVKGSQEKIIVNAESTSKENVQTPETIFKRLNNTMKGRGSEYGIKVYENELPEKIGPILIVDNKIVCSYLRGYTFEGYPLEVAYEILRSMILRKSLGIDKEDMKLHIDNIVRSLNSVQNITGNLSKMENLCSNTKIQIEELRKNISSELDQMLMKSFEKNKESKEEYVEKADERDNRKSFYKERGNGEENVEKEKKDDRRIKSRKGR